MVTQILKFYESAFMAYDFFFDMKLYIESLEASLDLSLIDLSSGPSFFKFVCLKKE